MNEHEEQFIRAFFEHRYRDRCLAKGGIPRDQLWHLGHFDPRRTFELPNNVHRLERLLPVLRQLTSSRTAFLISAHNELDGRELALDELPDVDGTIASLEPGRVAYYQEEWGPSWRGIFVKDPALARRAPEILETASAS